VRHTVYIFPLAMADMRAAVIWLGRKSPSSAAQLRDRLLRAIRSLATSPDRCPLADEAADLGLDLRELLFKRGRSVYRILFIIEGQTVNVLCVRNNAQDRLTAGDL